MLAYRQDRVRHLDPLPELVEEQTTWEPPVPGVSRVGLVPEPAGRVVTALAAVLVDDKPIRRFGKLAPQETSEVLEVPTARGVAARRRTADGCLGSKNEDPMSVATAPAQKRCIPDMGPSRRDHRSPSPIRVAGCGC